MNLITRHISAKIVVAMIIVLTVIMTISTVLIVERGGELLREELLVKATSLAKVGAKAMEGTLEKAVSSGRFTEAQVFDTSYQEIKTGPLAGAASRSLRPRARSRAATGVRCRSRRSRVART